MTTLGTAHRWQPPRGTRRNTLPTQNQAPPFDPLSLSGLLSWHDASDAATITDAGAGAVSAWADKSGNGRTLSQGTAANRPTTGTRTQNGLNVIDFDGTNDKLQAATDYVPAGTNTVMVYAVVKNDAAASYRWFFSAGTYPGAGQTRAYGMNGAAGKISIAHSSADLVTATDMSTGAHVFAIRDKSGAMEIRDNGVSIGTSANTFNVVALGAFAGCLSDGVNNFWDGWIAELILCSGEHDTTTQGLVETYLNDKW